MFWMQGKSMMFVVNGVGRGGIHALSVGGGGVGRGMIHALGVGGGEEVAFWLKSL